VDKAAASLVDKFVLTQQPEIDGDPVVAVVEVRRIQTTRRISCQRNCRSARRLVRQRRRLN
jgi:hypothetical protein